MGHMRTAAGVVVLIIAGWAAAAWADVTVEDYLSQKQDSVHTTGADTADKVLLDLIIDPAGPGTWEVRANLVGLDGGAPTTVGLGDLILDVTGSGGAVVTSSVCRAIQFEPADAPGSQAGFARIHGDGNNGIGIVGVQWFLYTGPNDPAKDRLVIQGAGMTSGSDLSTSGPVSWDPAFLVASGTFAGNGWLTATNSGEGMGVGWTLLSDLGGPGGLGWYGPQGVHPWSTYVIADTQYVPEPATLCLLALGGLAMIRRGK